ncbi:MAG TPA: hypothetical protein VFD04_02695 [Actinomycetes bacterium]|jgi:hypothetical protein|nr:hypothetical protein [Actinomycetes bacterium]
MSTTLTLSERLREAAATRGEQLLAELPATLRRLRLFLLVLSVSVPAFLAGLLALLAWRLLG